MTTANALAIEQEVAALPATARVASTRRRWIFRALAVVLALAVCEVQLQLASLCIPSVNYALLPAHLQARLDSEAPPMLIPDVVLGVRGNPEYPGHDSLGFRNAAVLEHPDVVTIGDSQTHSTHEQSWPLLHERETGHATYNMGISGWGPAEYLMVLDAALRKNPKVIVLGLYTGNDIADAYRSVVLRQACYELEMSVYPEGIDAVEREDLWNAEIRSLLNDRIDGRERKKTGGIFSACRNVLSDHCKLYGLARAIKNSASDHIQQLFGRGGESDRQWASSVKWSKRHPKTSVLELNHQRTILTPAYRSALIDMTDERIDAGLKLTFEAISQISKRCKARNVELVVAIIPTKEWVYDAVIETRREYPGMKQLMAYESTALESIASFLRGCDIEFLNVGNTLRDCVRSGQQPYPMTTDGHPNAVGNEAIAKAIAARTTPLLKQHELAYSNQPAHLKAHRTP
ncbi:MAG TPA: hypothetical protein PKN33_11535 [Phycisphaerae bacterium]|nr:hypothetical protein [Phycisphaerae bacterium]